MCTVILYNPLRPGCAQWPYVKSWLGAIDTEQSPEAARNYNKLNSSSKIMDLDIIGFI